MTVIADPADSRAVTAFRYLFGPYGYKGTVEQLSAWLAKTDAALRSDLANPSLSPSVTAARQYKLLEVDYLLGKTVDQSLLADVGKTVYDARIQAADAYTGSVTPAATADTPAPPGTPGLLVGIAAAGLLAWWLS